MPSWCIVTCLCDGGRLLHACGCIWLCVFLGKNEIYPVFLFASPLALLWSHRGWDLLSTTGGYPGRLHGPGGLTAFFAKEKCGKDPFWRKRKGSQSQASANPTHCRQYAITHIEVHFLTRCIQRSCHRFPLHVFSCRLWKKGSSQVKGKAV